MTQVPSPKTAINIDILDTKNADPLWALMEKMGFSKDRDYFERALERQELGELFIITAYAYGQMAGYCLLNWQPKYAYFRLHDIPEIQDLNVFREVRKQGIGRKIIETCENMVRDKGYNQIGIGVGLDSSFGPAQRLYISLGYIPDGNGITYDRKLVTPGEFRPIDENLSLMMTKSLK